MDMNTRRLSLSMLTVVLALSACAGPAERPAQPAKPEPVRGGTLHIAQIAPLSLDPGLVDDSYEAALVNQLHDGLLRHDSNLNLLPSLATSWQISRDGREYIFQLKRGAVFHDGSPVTAGDFVFSFSRVFRLDEDQSPLAREYLGVIEGASAYASGEADSVSGLSTEGDYVLKVRLARPYASFLHAVASEFSRVVPRAYVTEHGDEVFSTNPVGAGAFRLKSWKRGVQIELERFDDYHGGPSYLDGVVVHTPLDPVSPRAIAKFRRNELHMVDLTLNPRTDVSEVPGSILHRRRELSLTFLGFNTRRAPFKDVNVRRAVAHAVDHDRLTHMGKDGQTVATGVLPPGFPGYTPESKRLPFDPQKARELLEAAFHEENMPRGLRIAAPRRGTDSDLVIEDLCQQLVAVGLPARPELLDWDEFTRGLLNDEFDAFVLSWVADLPDPDAFFYPLFHSSGSTNHHHFSDTVLDQLLGDARAGTANVARMDAYREAEYRILNQAAVVPINFSTTLLAVANGVRGVELSSMGVAQLRLDHVWLDHGSLNVASNQSEVSR
jgi:peptide/nickel transport system substrate-binding protein/oligopeptide transport system substrate-binding protein